MRIGKGFRSRQATPEFQPDLRYESTVKAGTDLLTIFAPCFVRILPVFPDLHLISSVAHAVERKRIAHP